MRMEEAQRFSKKYVPEHFMWHIVEQVFDGLYALRGKKMNHGDCTAENILLNFPTIQSVDHPVPVIRSNLDYPDAVLADFMVEQTIGKTANDGLITDINNFFNNLWFLFDELVKDEAAEDCPYSE